MTFSQGKKIGNRFNEGSFEHGGCAMSPAGHPRRAQATIDWRRLWWCDADKPQIRRRYHEW